MRRRLADDAVSDESAWTSILASVTSPAVEFVVTKNVRGESGRATYLMTVIKPREVEYRVMFSYS